MDKMKNGAVLRNGTQRTAKEVFEKYAIVIAFLALLIVVSILCSSFLTPSNLILVLNQTSINGILVTKGKLAPYIVTLGFLTIIRGAALLIAGGRPISSLGDAYGWIGNHNVFGVIPCPVIIFLIVVVIGHIILAHLQIGRYIYAVGGNSNAAEACGISPNKVKMFVHVFCGTCAGLAGVILSSRVITGHPGAGEGYELDAIASAVVGGTSLAGGTGSIPGTVIGALIIAVIGNGLDLLGVSSYWQDIVKGAIIVVAVLLDRNKKRQ